MVCTVRCKQSQTDKKKNLYVPFLILDHIDPKQLLELHRQLVQEAHASGKQAIASLLNGMTDVLLAEKNQKKDDFDEKKQHFILKNLTICKCILIHFVFCLQVIIIKMEEKT